MADHTTNTTQKRLRILGDDEIQALYGRPRFADDERLEYFALSPTETVSTKPLYIFRALMHYQAEQRIVAPGYTLMQDTIGPALTHEQERLTTILSHYLSSSDAEKLHRLVDDAPGLYEMTQLKREPKDFSASEIKREIRRGKQIDDLYRLAQKLLPELKISNESIKYYASLVSYYSVSAFALKKRDPACPVGI